MELRWLSAPDDEVAAEMAALRHDSRPTWVPTRRQVLVHVNHCLMLWYLCIVFMTYGVRVDGYGDGQVDGSDIRGLTVTLAIFAVWILGTLWLYRWAARPPSPRARMNEWRHTLTALANGFEYRPSARVAFTSLITSGTGGARALQRFVAPGVEFGNLVQRGHRPRTWHYLAVTLPAPLPHLILDATSNNGIRSDLPARVGRVQRLSLEGDFDRWFHLYAPTTYRADALYFLTPDVMAALVDDASEYNIEIVDDTLVFFTSVPADFATPGPWQAIDAILGDAAARLVASGRRYRDERVPGQDIPPVLSAINAARTHPGTVWVAPRTRIGPDGIRLTISDHSTGGWLMAGLVGWCTVLAFLYAVPGVFAFAGFMSIVDGR